MRKKALFTCFTLLSLIFRVAAQEISVTLMSGDLNGDGVIDVADLAMLDDLLASVMIEKEVPFIANADVDGDGCVNIVDSVSLAKMLSVLSAGDLYSTDPIVGDLMYVPPGTFSQGSPANESCRPNPSNENVFRHTLIRHLAVMATEVTRQMWADLRAAYPNLGADPTQIYFGAGWNNPVQCVTWYRALIFANVLSIERGLIPCYYSDREFTKPLMSSIASRAYWKLDANGYRLPTEGEWEYCCRAGTVGPFWISEPNYRSDNCTSCSSGILPNLEMATVFCANKSDGPYGAGESSAVATKLANPWGLYDMHGNVNEWCWDCYQFAYPTGNVIDYTGPAEVPGGEELPRVGRGGCWIGSASGCRSARRSPYLAGNGGTLLGFRLVRTLP